MMKSKVILHCRCAGGEPGNEATNLLWHDNKTYQALSLFTVLQVT